ncbi:hypothetical protein [Amycolatopsis jiangsuensis]|uniref:MmpS family membrane protein n=1 Tax=Amycolatopsis jiangsuensis TaxID=1181879 RepID=A0A840J3M2_9PSEU|nr:hypothetical protein [Amycolatopsis jiangsuensis]MBB4687904.1 hypothetical protein [Amycolatopsis jiangsuensis]
MTPHPPRPAAPPRHGRPTVPADPQHAPRPPRRANVPGGVAVACGLAAAGVAFLPKHGYVAWLVAGVGLLAGVIGAVLAARGRMRGLAVASTGVVLSVLAALLYGATLLYPSMFGTPRSSELHIPPVSGDSHTVDFVVTSAGGATVRYGTLDDQRTDSAPASTDQWHGHASYDGGAPILSVTADTANGGVTNQISCAIVVDGQTVAENDGTTIALCTANVD